MRTAKELIGLDINELTREEKILLKDYNLDCCDNCGDIDFQENLRWIDDDNHYDVPMKFCDECFINLQAKNNNLL
jgi:hypothetical protein